MSHHGAGGSKEGPQVIKQVTVQTSSSNKPKPTTKKPNKQNKQADLDVAREFQRCIDNNEDRLDLSKQNITMIPPSVKDCTTLGELYLYSNKISFLPPEIGFLHNLKTLALNENSLTSLPSTLANLKHLKVKHSAYYNIFFL